MPWMADDITGTGLGAGLRSGLDSAEDTPPSSRPAFRDERPVPSAVSPSDAQVHTTPVCATEQAGRTIQPAAELRSGHDGAQNGPPTSLPVIHNERQPSAAVTPIDVQVHPTSVTARQQAAHTT